jgi:hypothetical protein
MHEEQLHELLFQALETELGGVKVYETALRPPSVPPGPSRFVT